MFFANFDDMDTFAQQRSFAFHVCLGVFVVLCCPILSGRPLCMCVLASSMIVNSQYMYAIAQQRSPAFLVCLDEFVVVC